MGEKTSGKLALVMPLGGEDGAAVGELPKADATPARGEVRGVVDGFLGGEVVGIAIGLMPGGEVPGDGSILDGDRIVVTTSAGQTKQQPEQDHQGQVKKQRMAQSDQTARQTTAQKNSETCIGAASVPESAAANQVSKELPQEGRALRSAKQAAGRTFPYSSHDGPSRYTPAKGGEQT